MKASQSLNPTKGVNAKPAIKMASSKKGKIAKVAFLVTKLNYLKHVEKRDDTYLGEVTADTLKTLSPVFIKIGQFISTRSDVFGKEYTAELAKLQDNIPPFDISLPTSIKDAFAYINEEQPIATASIGQVHYARLKTGEEVVIKVKRPNIEELIREDFSIIMTVLSILRSFNKSKELEDTETLLKQYQLFLMEEINFEKEVSNMQLFQRMFARTDTQYIKVPKTYQNISDNDHIVMEYLPAIKINEKERITNAGMDTSKISRKLIECFLIQIIEYGYVHTDPHPGNVGITERGKIVLYDFGMVLKLDQRLKGNFKCILLALYDQDIEEMVRLLVDLDIVIVDPKNIPYLKRFVVSFMTYINNLDLDKFKEEYIDKIDQRDVPFILSSKFFMLLRGMSILEGVCRDLDPEFSYQDVLNDFVGEFAFDIDYFERRGNNDIEQFRNTPQKVYLNEVSLGILEKKVDSMANKNKLLEKAVGFMNIFVLVDPDIPLPLPAKLGLAAATFILLYTR